jgi:hypothetical protein
MNEHGHDRRTHQRVWTTMPVTVRRPERSPHPRTVVTHDIGAGGIRFNTDETDLRVGETIAVRMTIPKAMGYLPRESRAMAEARVVRVEPDSAEPGDRPVCVRVAARFSRPIRLDW